MAVLIVKKQGTSLNNAHKDKEVQAETKITEIITEETIEDDLQTIEIAMMIMAHTETKDKGMIVEAEAEVMIIVTRMKEDTENHDPALDSTLLETTTEEEIHVDKMIDIVDQDHVQVAHVLVHTKIEDTEEVNIQYNFR